MKQFEKIYWHDGQISEFRVVAPSKSRRAEISLELNLYADEQAKNRDIYLIVFSDVLRFTASVDMMGLKDNYLAGNLYRASGSENGSKVYRFYLLEGYIEIESKKVKIKKQKSGI